MSRKVEEEIIFVAGLHGNEQMPVKALEASATPFVLGNPMAKKKNVRFVEKDLNSSFGLKTRKKYEEKRAHEILQEIQAKTLVVDLHTTTAKTPPFVIIVDKKMLSLAARTGLLRVVLMRHNIKKGHALINYRDGISVEVGNHNSKGSYRTTLKVVKNILKNKKHRIKLYEVYGKITKPGNYQNFKKHPDGFIPVLAGEKAYNFYGLKARLIS